MTSVRLVARTNFIINVILVLILSPTWTQYRNCGKYFRNKVLRVQHRMCLVIRKTTLEARVFTNGFFALLIQKAKSGQILTRFWKNKLRK